MAPLKHLGILGGVLVCSAFAKPTAAEWMVVTWYGPEYAGYETASGEIFDPWSYTAAHPYWPLGTEVRVTNPDNGASVIVRVNDRMDWEGLDVSEQAAVDLGIYEEGVATLDVEVLIWGE